MVGVRGGGGGGGAARAFGTIPRQRTLAVRSKASPGRLPVEERERVVSGERPCYIALESRQFSSERRTAP